VTAATAATAATAKEKAVEETERVVVARAVAGHAAAHGGGWACGASGMASERVEEVESTVVAWAGTATVAATAAVTVTVTEVTSGQSPEGTGAAWVGASIGEARAAREARAEAVALNAPPDEQGGVSDEPDWRVEHGERHR
jgi:hypothetical protein